METSKIATILGLYTETKRVPLKRQSFSYKVVGLISV